MTSTISIKKEMLKLLKEDEEFRYAVAGIIGLDEIIKRLDKHDAKFVEILERLDRHEEELVRLRQDTNKLREDMIAGFKRHDEEIAKLREEMYKGFKRHDEEITKLREDMIAGFKRHDEEIAKLREEMYKGFKRHDDEIAKLREDMIAGFSLVERHISALGARWGLISEEAFREGIKGLVEKEFKFKVEKWIRFDEKGSVFGYPSQIDIDLAIHNKRIILIEIKSHIRASDVYTFKRKVEFYEIVEGKKPSRLLIVTPYAEEKALEAAMNLGVEVYTKI
jgi:hypothetical protein